MEMLPARTPFTGLPPGQVIHSVAKAVVNGNSTWAHSLAFTRGKVLALARVHHGAEVSGTEDTPKPAMHNNTSEMDQRSNNWRSQLFDSAVLECEVTPKQKQKGRRPLGMQREDSMTGAPAVKDLDTLSRSVVHAESLK